MKITIHFVIIITLFSICACTSTKKIIEQAELKEKVNLRQALKEEKKKEGNKSNVLPKTLFFTNKEGKQFILGDTEKDSVTGEDLLNINLDEVFVYSKSKTVPERNGKINISFIVTVPTKFINSNWKLNIIPKMYDENSSYKLAPLVIYGKNFYNNMDRYEFLKKDNYKKEISLLEKINNREQLLLKNKKDSSLIETIQKKKEKYKEWINKGKSDKESYKLDTIIKGDKLFEFYYSQDFSTENMMKKIKVSFDSNIVNLKDENYNLKNSDTINYFLSSMTQFLDRTPRYIRTLITRKVTNKASAYLTFEVGKYNIDENLDDNKAELEKIKNKMIEINNQNEFIIDSISINANCSPEGDNNSNINLSKLRGQSLKEHLNNVISMNAEAEDLVSIKYNGENWHKLLSLIDKDTYIENKEAIKNIINSQIDNDNKENKIKAEYNTDYTYIVKELYPKLRNVDFIFYLSRKGMVEDYVYSDVIDTTYANAIKLMDERKYSKAMPKLLEYSDINTVICYMSLGYNDMAFEILKKQKDSADKEYLLSILYARKNDPQEAVKHFMESCKMDETKIMRGELDPEIAILIKQYNLTEQLY